MCRINVYANENRNGDDFGPVIDHHTADTAIDCLRWAEDKYGADDFTCSFADDVQSFGDQS